MDIKSEILSITSWEPHSTKNNTALVEGKTRWIVKMLDDLTIAEDNRKEFPLISKMMNEVVTNLGRSYIHRLRPNESIRLHNDSKIGIAPFIKQRYQYFIDIPDGVVINCEGCPKPNEVFLFNHIVDHSYYNGSNQNFYMVVFDDILGN